jgi:tetratricopeptide (TPR) repeat protein
MLIELLIIIAAVATLLWLVLYMRAQRPVTSVQRLIQQHRYADAMAEADRQIGSAGQPSPAAAGRRRAPEPPSLSDTALWLHRAEAAKLLGRFDEAIASYRAALAIDRDDAAAREGLALALGHQNRDLAEAARVMEETIASHPQIQEFQALAFAWILLRSGRREEALRLFDDNLVLLQTRFRDDYTDPDPLLAETLWMFAELSRAAGDEPRAVALHAQAAAWAPGSVFAGR